MSYLLKRIICKLRGHNDEKIQMLNPVTHELVRVDYMCRRCGHYTIGKRIAHFQIMSDYRPGVVV